MNLSIKGFVEDSTFFAYSKRGLFNRDKSTWSKWKEEKYTNEEMHQSAEKYTKQGLSWYRSTVGHNHTLFVLDFDIELPLADIIINNRLTHSLAMEDRKKRYKENINIEKFRFDVHELAMQEFLSTTMKTYPEILDFSWKFSGGVGRRHAMQKTDKYIDPKGFRKIFEHIANKMNMSYHDERNFHFEGDVTYQGAIYQYIIKLDLAMTDPDRLIRGVYSPHFKDKIYRFSIPIPNSKLLDTDYIRDNCYRIQRIESYDIKPFTYKEYYDTSIPNFMEKKTKIKNFTIKKAKGVTQHVSLDMGKVPQHIHFGLTTILDKLTTLPCMDVKQNQSHAPRTRFGNVSTQRYTPEIVTAYFRDVVNDKEHNNNIHFSYYHLQRLRPNGTKGFKYWNCGTFQNKKNNFSITKKECAKCPVYKKYQNKQGLQHKQSPWWVFSIIDNEFKVVEELQQDRDKLRAKLKIDIHDMITNKVQFNEIQAPVRTGKTKTIIDAITERSHERGTETVFFVGNIAGTKENIHEEATKAGYNGRVMEWGSKKDLCPIKLENPGFIVTAGFCKSCKKKQRVEDVFEGEELDTVNARWQLPQSPNKQDWITNLPMANDKACNYFAMKKIITKSLYAQEDNILLIADPRFIMQRDLIVTANRKTYDWIQLFNYIVYDEAHTLINVAYDTLTKDVDFIIKQEDTVNDWLDIIDPTKQIKRTFKGIKALTLLQNIMKKEASDLTIYKSKEILDVSNAESSEILNQSTLPLQKYISELSTDVIDEAKEFAVSKLLDLVNLHNWMIINHSGEDNWFDLYLFGKSNKIYYNQKELLATNYTLILKAKLQEDKNEYLSITDITFPILPLHHAKKVIFMSATPNKIANEILYFPTRLYSYFPKNQAKIIFNFGNTLSKKRVDSYEKHILTLVDGISKHGKNKVLLVSDNKKRLPAILKNKNVQLESYHPRDAKNAEGTTLRGFDVSIAINTSVQNIVSIENQSHIMAEIWDYDITTIKMMFQEMSLARVIQAVARTMPYTDDAEPVTYILLDDRFVHSANKVIEWLSPSIEPIVLIKNNVTFSNLVDEYFKDNINAMNDINNKLNNLDNKRNRKYRQNSL